MSCKKMIPYINAEHEVLANVLVLAQKYAENGADELLIYNFSEDDTTREEFFDLARSISKNIDIPFHVGCHVSRFEDVKKAIYTGADKVLIRYDKLENKKVLSESSERFGAAKIMVEMDAADYLADEDNLNELLTAQGMGTLFLKHLYLSENAEIKLGKAPFPVIIRDSLVRNDISNLLRLSNIEGIATNFYENRDIMKAKNSLKENGIEVNVFESKIAFHEFKLNPEGLIPVITTDYRTGEVLMLAYMNEEAYNKTIATGRMTYYSRSRNSLWLKGETSGHFQYVKSMAIDCDKDTILAKVKSIGPACHTGSQSCFFTNLMEKEGNHSNPLYVLEEVFQVILDRKKNPKEGSYTNYLFEKGMDKILKKCGEEATEIIIAAKNPNSEELRYEIADFLYHMMVLMVECGLDWADVLTELANRK